jgi:hypothetical protein
VAHQAQVELAVTQEQVANLVPQVQAVLLVTQVFQDKALLATQVSQEQVLLVTQVYQVQVHPVTQEQAELRVSLVTQEQVAHQAFQVRAATQE